MSEVPKHSQDPEGHQAHENPKAPSLAYERYIRSIHGKESGHKHRREKHDRKQRKGFYDLVCFVCEESVVCLLQSLDCFLIGCKVVAFLRPFSQKPCEIGIKLSSKKRMILTVKGFEDFFLRVYDSPEVDNVGF